MLGLKYDSDKKWHYIQEYLNAINFQSSSTDKENYQIPTVRELLDLTAFCAPPIAIMDYMAERKQRANTFVYNFDYRRIDDQFSKVTPCHTAELPFVFGNGLSQDHPGDLALSQHMQDY
jgi:carboxylesterase type B